MPILEFTHETMPKSGAELKAILQQLQLSSSPIEDLIKLVRDLKQLEIKHQMDSADFYTQFQAGKLGDSIEFMRWANKYEFYQAVKTDIESVFN
ncbi:MAG: hypothetical protein H6668_02585 [Ardenticatenaceae bacterium]|nr:hypothetical protein [Ardenticatenaceae bacterium]